MAMAAMSPCPLLHGSVAGEIIIVSAGKHVTCDTKISQWLYQGKVQFLL